MAIENCNKSSISIKRVKSTKIGLKETESNKACTSLICNKSYELVRFLWSYEIHPFEFAIHSGGCEVWAEYRIANRFRSNLTIEAIKLISYARAQLIWCLYFKQKCPFYHHRIFEFVFLIFKNHDGTLKWQKTRVLCSRSQQHSLDRGGTMSQSTLARKNQSKRSVIDSKMTITPSSCVFICLIILRVSRYKQSEFFQTVSKTI